MRVALTIRRFPPFVGGAERQAQVLAEALDGAGHEVCVFTGGDRRAPSAEGERQETVVRLRESPTGPVGTARFLVALGKALRAARPDVILAFQCNETSCASWYAARRLGIPFLLRVSNVGPYGNLEWTRRHWAGALFRHALRRADRAIAQADYFRDELERFGCAPEAIRTIPNAVPIPRASGRANEPPAGPPRVVWAGRITHQKDPLLIAEIARAVAAEGASARFDIFGAGELEGQLAEKLRGLPKGVSARLHGAVGDMTPHLLNGSVFLNTARSEGLSNAILEAMAAGLPVVATRVGGTPELVRDEHGGYLYDEGDAAGAVEAIARLVRNADLRRTIGKKARESAIERYAPAQIAAVYGDLFDELRRERGRRKE